MVARHAYDERVVSQQDDGDSKLEMEVGRCSIDARLVRRGEEPGEVAQLQCCTAQQPQVSTYVSRPGEVETSARKMFKLAGRVGRLLDDDGEKKWPFMTGFSARLVGDCEVVVAAASQASRGLSIAKRSLQHSYWLPQRLPKEPGLRDLKPNGVQCKLQALR